MRIRSWCLAVVLLATSSLQAASLGDSVLEIPRGSVFSLRSELEVPANRNFILLGKHQLNETFNELNQVYNDQKGRYYGRHGYYHYNDYLNQWQQTVDQSYRECLERHRTYYSYGGSSGSTSSTIVNKGVGNTNIIINNQSATEPSYGSYIGNNTCVRPEHTIAILLLDPNKAGGGGIFRDGYEFKVKSVRQRHYGNFHAVTIRFDHKIAKGIRIISTQSPEQIRIHQLQAQDYGSGFLEGLGAALGSLVDIGGDWFDIALAEKQYFD